MTPAEQAAAIRLLRRWRDLCVTADRAAAVELEDDLVELTILFVETDQFLNPGAPSIGGTH